MSSRPVRSAQRLAAATCLAGLTLALPSLAEARPNGPGAFCEQYPSSPDCLGRLITCDTCHDSTDPVLWNSYGTAVTIALAGRDFDTYLSEALAAVESEDADDDGESNLDEILIGTNPGRAESLWQPLPEPTGLDNPWYSLGEYDAVLAYRRMSALYCGQSPDYATLESVRALSPSEQRERVHEDLALCLDSAYWRGRGLRELADPRVRPLESVGIETEINLYGALLALADYYWDYRLWRYVLSDDRDLRELLTAQYHVIEAGDGTLERIEGEQPNPFLGGGQPLEPEHRAGMITTQWFLVINTMLSPIPRTTAAHALRSYLDMDISRHEGIFPVAGEPTDIDNKGVKAPACAQCHSTLDPLAYVFANYHGIKYPTDNGKYDEQRLVGVIDGWEPDSVTSVVFGESVSSVPEWAAVASESIYFRRAMTNMFVEHALGHSAMPAEMSELAALVETLPADGYSANRLIHRIVDTDAFGAP